MILLHVIADGAHQLLVETHQSRVTLELLDVAVVVAGRAAGVGLLLESAVAAATAFTFFLLLLDRVFDCLDLLEHFEHIVLLVLLPQVVLGLDQELKHLPNLRLLMSTHLQGLRVVHLGQYAPEHHMRKSQVLLRFLDQEIFQAVTCLLLHQLVRRSSSGCGVSVNPIHYLVIVLL
jgi:hypothetical protein